MYKNFCDGCNAEIQFACVINKIISSIKMESFLNGDILKKINVPVCHCNAQEIKNNRMIIKEGCDGCALCQITCPKTNNQQTLNNELEKTLFSNLNFLNIYLANVCRKCKIGSEIKSFGNYRQKRIDIVIQKENRVYLIKVLSDLNKYRFYMDSYNEQIAAYNNNFEEYNFNAFLIIKQSEVLSAKKMNFNVITIADLIKILGE